jgi:hypothetical protein
MVDYDDLSDEELEATSDRLAEIRALGSPFRFVSSFLAAVQQGRIEDARLLLSPDCDPIMLRIDELPFIGPGGRWSLISEAEQWSDGRSVILVTPAPPSREDGRPGLVEREEVPDGLPIVVSYSEELGWSIDGPKALVLENDAFMAPGGPGRAVHDFVEDLITQGDQAGIGKPEWFVEMLALLRDGSWHVRQRPDDTVLDLDRVEAWILLDDAGPSGGGVKVVLKYDEEVGWMVAGVGT